VIEAIEHVGGHALLHDDRLLLDVAIVLGASTRRVGIGERDRGRGRRGDTGDRARIGMRRIGEERLVRATASDTDGGDEQEGCEPAHEPMVHLGPMRAITITKPGGPEVLALVDRPVPAPSRGEVRVRVRATAVNRADLLQRMGAYPAPAGEPADVPGLEFAGEVDAVGADVERLRVGDRVFGLVGGGAYAEYIVSHERAVAKMPDSLSFVDGAAIPEAFITAHDAIVTQAGLTSGESLVIHAAGSGVGTAAVQLGRALGAHVIGTARTQDKLDRARALGMDDGIVPSGTAADPRFADAVRGLTGGGASVVLELVGGAYFAEDLRAVATRGRIVLVGLMAGAKTEIDLGLVLRKRVRVFGTVLRARPLEEKIAAVRAFEGQVVPLVARGACKPVIDVVMPLSDAAGAHERMASNTGFGKIVLTV